MVLLLVVFGYEGVGVVEVLGFGVKEFKVGDYVVLIYGVCGYCNLCSGGYGVYCCDFFSLNFGGGVLDGSIVI